MYFYNASDQKLEWAIEGGAEIIEANKAGEVTILKFGSSNEPYSASIDAVLWNA